MNFSKLIAALVSISMIHTNTSLPSITYVDVHPDEYLKLDCHFIQTVGDSWVALITVLQQGDIFLETFYNLEILLRFLITDNKLTYVY